MAALRILSASGRAFRKVVIWISANEADVAASPTITSGASAPSTSVGASTEPRGSIYLSGGATTAANGIFVTFDSGGGNTWVAIDGT